MKAAVALTAMLAVTAGGVLAIGLVAAATATAEGCPPTAVTATAGQAPRAGRPTAPPPADGPALVCQPATAGTTGGAAPGAGGADAAFDPGTIASDEVFYDTTAMTAAQITAFIDEQNAGCHGPWCLKNLTVDTTSEPADAYCHAYPAGRPGPRRRCCPTSPGPAASTRRSCWSPCRRNPRA